MRVTNILQVMAHVVNGQTKKTNGLLCQILTKVIVGLGLNYDTKLLVICGPFGPPIKSQPITCHFN
jgi:hypothetical protein